ncbi:MAG: DUF697 domain-containing protein [Gemmataceae bacterium]|nr:DUF697 domain-containing protein [Gemmataceae bacterium]
MLGGLKNLFSARQRDAALQQRLEELRHRTPVPVFWLYGKTQSGKTSLIKFLTGADDAEIGHGFKPCTRFSRQYQFPTAEAPLITFLDTRGVDEPGYDPAEDLARFDALAHVVIITVKVLDHALEHLLDHFHPIRSASPTRPVVLVPTCLHEAYPQQQHPQPYPFTGSDGAAPPDAIPEELRASLDEQRRRFHGLADAVIPVDLTRPEEGFSDPNYGGDRLKEVLLGSLPAAYRRTLIALDEATNELQDLFAQHALPHILGYSSLAASAGAIPIPWVDLFIIPGIQTRMIYHLARLYGQPLRAERFLELASTLGLGLVVRQAIREVVKFIPFVGSVVGAALAGAATFALGKAFCFYYSAVHKGHVPQPEELRRYYQEQLTRAEQLWRKGETVPG